MEDFISRYGLVGVFLGTLLEGDVTVILAGVVAHLGMLDYRLVLAVAFAGGLLRDGAFYLLGRSSLRARHSQLYARTVELVERLVGRFGPMQILIAPFMYGARAASMIFWGVRGLSPVRFLALDAIACAVWVVGFSGAGYLLSDRVQGLVGEVKKVELWLAGALIVALAVALALRAAWKKV